MSTENKKYSVGELAALSGVSRRTIRFYVQRELIPPPLGLGRGNHYTDEHLDIILKIRSLQRDGFVLDQMKSALKGEVLEEIKEPEREIVTRVRLAEGAWIEFSQGRKVPSPKAIAELSNLLKKFSGEI